MKFDSLSSLLCLCSFNMEGSSQEMILTCCLDGSINAFDLLSGRSLLCFPDCQSPSKGLVLAGNDMIAHASAENCSGLIKLYNCQSSTFVNRILMPVPVGPLAATADGFHLFCGDISGRINTISLPSGHLKKSISINETPLSCLEIVKEGSLLISGSNNGVLTVVPIWMMVSEESGGSSTFEAVLRRLVGHTAPVTAITSGIGGCNCTIISSSLDMTCRFWNLMHGSALMTVVFPCSINSVSMNLDESYFFAAGSDGVIYKGAMKVASRKLKKQGLVMKPLSPRHLGAAVSIQMTRGDLLVSASEDGSVWVWDIEAEKVIKELELNTRGISDMIVAQLAEDWEWNRDYHLGICVSSACSSIAEAVELEKTLKVVEEERKRSVDKLHRASSMYEKMLQLTLKEAKRHGTKGRGDGMGDKNGV